jgi:hypothetical protein
MVPCQGSDFQKTLEYGALSFPMKLHTMLDDAEKLGFQDVVCWQKGGNSFKVLLSERFSATIMRDYFNQTMYKSFQRQLNIYGFRRIHSGVDKGGYTHRCFIRGSTDLSSLVLRKPAHQKLHSTAMAQKLPEIIPVSFVASYRALLLYYACLFLTDRYNISILQIMRTSKTLTGFYDGIKKSSFHLDDDELDLFAEIDDSEESFDFGLSSFLDASDDHAMLAQHHDKHIRTATETSMGELMNLLGTNKQNTEETHDEDDEKDETGRIFPWKLHHMLENVQQDNNFEHIVSWVHNGSAFKVHDSDQFVEKVMPLFFDQTKYESFRRQLNLYGFSRISRGQQRGVYSHPFFVRNNRSLCQHVVRRSAKNIKPPMIMSA